jgi:hypothetical protein
MNAALSGWQKRKQMNHSQTKAREREHGDGKGKQLYNGST